MKYDVKKVKIDTKYTLGKGHSKMKKGHAIAGLKDEIEDLAKPPKIDTKFEIKKKKMLKMKY